MNWFLKEFTELTTWVIMVVAGLMLFPLWLYSILRLIFALWMNNRGEHNEEYGEID